MFRGIGRKLTLAFFVIILCVLASSTFVWRRLESVEASSTATTRNIEASFIAAAKVQSSIFDQIWVVAQSHENEIVSAMEKSQDARKEIDGALQILRESGLMTPSDSDSLFVTQQRFQRLVLRMFEVRDSLRRTQPTGGTRKAVELSRTHQVMMMSLDRLHRRLEEILLTIQPNAAVLMAQHQVDNNNATNEVKLSLVLLVIFSLFVTTVTWFMTEQRVTRPMQKLTDEVKAIGSKGVLRHVDVGGYEETRLLQESINGMIDDLQKNIKKRQEDELELMREHKLAAIGQLAQGIAHNLNNPLGVILLSCEVLTKKHPSIFDLEMIARSAEKMKMIINTLLHKSRQEQTEARQLININDLIAEELQFLEADIEFKHKVEKDIRLDPKLPLMLAVYSDLSQSIMNIVRNGLDAMYHSATKRLVLETRFDDKNIYVDIGDTGCGIPEQNIPRLFDPFFTTKPLKGTEVVKEPTGTGLGLSSCNQLLQPYNATIAVKSKLGAGSTFTIAIPCNTHQNTKD